VRGAEGEAGFSSASSIVLLPPRHGPVLSLGASSLREPCVGCVRVRLGRGRELSAGSAPRRGDGDSGRCSPGSGHGRVTPRDTGLLCPHSVVSGEAALEEAVLGAELGDAEAQGAEGVFCWPWGCLAGCTAVRSPLQGQTPRPVSPASSPTAAKLLWFYTTGGLHPAGCESCLVPAARSWTGGRDAVPAPALRVAGPRARVIFGTASAWGVELPLSQRDSPSRGA